MVLLPSSGFLQAGEGRDSADDGGSSQAASCHGRKRSVPSLCVSQERRLLSDCWNAVFLQDTLTPELWRSTIGPWVFGSVLGKWSGTSVHWRASPRIPSGLASSLTSPTVRASSTLSSSNAPLPLPCSSPLGLGPPSPKSLPRLRPPPRLPSPAVDGISPYWGATLHPLPSASPLWRPANRLGRRFCRQQLWPPSTGSLPSLRLRA